MVAILRQDAGAFLLGGLQGGVDEALAFSGDSGVERAFHGLIVREAVDEILDGVLEGGGEIVGREILSLWAILGLDADGGFQVVT